MIQIKLIFIFGLLKFIECQSPIDIVSSFLKAIGHKENQEIPDEIILRKKYDFIIGTKFNLILSQLKSNIFF